MESMVLMGTEEVRRAADVMRDAANTIASASDNMAHGHRILQQVIEQHEHWMNAWLDRFDEVVERMHPARSPATDEAEGT
jgi:hypothetical protein